MLYHSDLFLTHAVIAVVQQRTDSSHLIITISKLIMLQASLELIEIIFYLSLSCGCGICKGVAIHLFV